MNFPNIDAVLFDLDGTLLDTHLDLCNALNQVLLSHGKAELPTETLRPFVSKGAMVMVCLAFRCQPQSDEAISLWGEMIEFYLANISQFTGFFDGMEKTIDQIEFSGKKWGIVTNKPAAPTTQLLNELSLSHRPSIVVAGDTLKVKKPDPEPLLYACREMNTAPNRCIYVGDDERDILAGKAAKMPTIAVSYGYIPFDENPADWGADLLIDRPSELIKALTL